ncbi:MAG: hypothetical protein H7177_00475 [Rhizobacter sp.]|nr:hypothetical protein [Bacteriovorax sp.]
MNFKALILIALSVPFMASANTTCYTTKTPIIRYLPAKYYVPATICLESISESVVSNEINVESADGSLPKNFTITKLSIHNEDRYTFSAKNVLVDEDYSANACGSFEKAVLTIAGESTVSNIGTSDLTITLKVENLKDACHSDVRTEYATYELVK